MKLPAFYPVFLLLSAALGRFVRSLTDNSLPQEPHQQNIFVKWWKGSKYEQRISSSAVIHLLKAPTFNFIVNTILLLAGIAWTIWQVRLWLETHNPRYILNAQWSSFMVLGIYFLPVYKRFLQRFSNLTDFGFTASLILPLVLVVSFFHNWYEGAVMLDGKEVNPKVVIEVANTQKAVKGIILYSLDKYLVMWSSSNREIELLPQSMVTKIRVECK